MTIPQPLNGQNRLKPNKPHGPPDPIPIGSNVGEVGGGNGDGPVIGVGAVGTVGVLPVGNLTVGVGTVAVGTGAVGVAFGAVGTGAVGVAFGAVGTALGAVGVVGTAIGLRTGVNFLGKLGDALGRSVVCYKRGGFRTLRIQNTKSVSARRLCMGR